MKTMCGVQGISGSLLACALVASMVVGVAVDVAGAQTRNRSTQRAPLAGTVDLRAKFERERATVYEVDLMTEQRLELGEVTQEYTGAYKSRVAITLERSNAELTTVKLTHERVAVTFEGRGGGPGVPMGSYDSDNPDAAGTTEVYRDIIAPMIGKAVQIDLMPSGEIVAIRGLAQMAPEGTAGLLFREMFTEQTFRDMYGWLFALKAEPSTAEIGESWQMVQSANNPLGTLRRVHELALDRVSGGTATISISGKNELQGSVPDMFEVKPPAGTPMVQGEAEWDTEKNQVISLQSVSKTNVESNMPGMGVKMTVNAETRVKRVDRK